MKKILILLLCLLLTASITGCGTQSIKPIDTIEGNMKTYSEMSDGTWQCDGHIYKYRLEISGRLSNAVKDSTYIYLSNIEDITFEQAGKHLGLAVIWMITLILTKQYWLNYQTDNFQFVEQIRNKQQ